MITLKLGKYTDNEKDLLMSALTTALEHTTNSQVASWYTVREKAMVARDIASAIGYLSSSIGN